MGDFPTSYLAGPPIIHPCLFPESVYHTSGVTTLNAAASVAWATNNQAMYYPFTLSAPVIVYDLFFWVGATQSGNIDVGIYDDQKNRIVSAGSTAMSATVNAVQVLACTDTTLLPGDYLMGGACSSSTGTCFGVTGSTDEISLGQYPIYTQATAMALPDPCAPTLTTVATPILYIFGAICRTVF